MVMDSLSFYESGFRPSSAVGHLGPSGLFELLTLVGYYATLALQLRVFRAPAPDSPAPDSPSPDSPAAPA